jgi:serine protease inhibitor
MTNLTYLWVILGIFVLIIFTTGCVEETSISGVDKITEVSGKEIIISGINNHVKILNKNVSKIEVSGVDHIVLYPQEANPQIIDSGINTTIRTYS